MNILTSDSSSSSSDSSSDSTSSSSSASSYNHKEIEHLYKNYEELTENQQIQIWNSWLQHEKNKWLFN